MVREFTDKKLEELLKYAESREEMSWLERRWDEITDLYTRVTTVWTMELGNLFKSDYISGNKEREKKYRAAIVDVEDYGEAQLRTMFRIANEQNEIEAAKIRGLHDEGERLLRELKTLAEIITPTGEGVSPLSGNAALESVGNSCETVTVHVPKEKYMSYLEYEKHVIDNMELGQKFEAMSFDEFQRDILHCK